MLYDVTTYTCKFATADPRRASTQDFRPKKAQRRNDRFDLKFFLPKLAEGTKQNHILIVVNGFGETNLRVYIDDRSGICSHFARLHGIASVLMPLPFHLNRFDPTDYTRDDWPDDLVKLIYRRKNRFWYGFVQTLGDIGKLVRLIRTQSEKFFSRNFSEHTKVHLLGYSLGGLGVLSYQLEAAATGTGECDKLLLLSSGCDLKTLVPDEFKNLTRMQWDEFVSHYVDDNFLNEVGVDHDSLYYRIFKSVVAGARDESLQPYLSKQVGNTAVVLGGEDSTNRYQWALPPRIIEVPPKEKDKQVLTKFIPLFHTMIIPGMKHSLVDLTCRRAQEYIISFFANFIKESPHFSIPSDDGQQ